MITIRQLLGHTAGLDNDVGEILSGLATGWEADAEQVTLTLGEDVTCADGTPFTASDAAANLNFIADPENASPFLGTSLPAGVTATGEDDSGTLTVEPGCAPP